MKLDNSFVFKRFKKELEAKYGSEKAAAIWRYAECELQKLESAEPNADKNSRTFVFPAAALYRAVEYYAPGEALEVTRAYGTKTGIRLKNIFRKVTSLPGIPTLMWNNMDKIAAKMSSGYECRDVVVTEHLCSLDVTGCPLYDKAKALGTPEAVQMICCMDKEYMTGFRGVKYTRTKSVAEGNDCCDYRLRDARKKGISDFVKRYGRDIAEHMEVIVRPGKEHCEAMAQVPDYVEKIEERITGTRPVMIRLQGLDEDQIREISRQIADAFYDYKYNEEDIGLIRFIPTREDMFTYIYAIVRAAYRSGVLYTTSDRREGYLMLSGEGAGGTVGFVDGIKMIAAEKKALGGIQNMKQFIDACFSDGGTIETRMRKEKRKFLRIEMLVVRKEFQGQGYMRRMMDFAYALAEERRIPVILDTDDRDKASRYEHLGMKLDRVRICGERFHMYDLIRE